MRRAVPSRDSRIVKKLLPGTPGAKRLTERYGDALVCVRYRVDATQARRFTTVELVVDDFPLPAARTPDVLVRVAWDELDLRRKVKEAGGEWQPDKKLWRLPRTEARKLGLLDRVTSPPQKSA